MSRNDTPRRPNLNFLEMGVGIGSILHSRITDMAVEVVDPKRVRLGDEVISLTEATRRDRGYTGAPTDNWTVNGQWLQDLYRHTYGERGKPTLSPSLGDDVPFDPRGIEDGRQRVWRSIIARRGQSAFRDALMRAYEERCAVTGCSVQDVLEAAHIVPYRGPKTNAVSNGILLRADLHTLFDCRLIAIDPGRWTVIVSPQLRSSEYENLHGRQLRLPRNPSEMPSREALSVQRREAGL
jgi:hypothetical protein